MKKITLYLLILVSAFFIVSCKKSLVFDQFVTFSNANWSFESKAVNFAADITGSDYPHEVVLELSVIGTPNVELFYATFTTVSPNGAKTVKSIIFNFNSPKEPYIQGDSPNQKIYRLVVYPKKYFTETGIYSFEVNQFSNKADNYGIQALRMYIEKGKKEK